VRATADDGVRLPPEPAPGRTSAPGTDGAPGTPGRTTSAPAPDGTSGPPATGPAAVLWDMDGTLVDTEPYWIACEFDLVAEHGGTWSLEHAHSLVGNALPESAEYIRQHGGVDLPPNQIVQRLLDGVVARVREHVPWRPGAQELLSALRADGIPCALVTMSYRRLTDAVLAGLPAGTFAAVVAGDDVRQGKPHPEPYLTAAVRLGVPPRRCLAVEDSPTGLASAVAAGVPALGVVHLLALEPGPDRHLVDTLAGLAPVDLAGIYRTITAGRST
jgi:HAD superfamily hydrolase (TIGR01509 family)